MDSLPVAFLLSVFSLTLHFPVLSTDWPIVNVSPMCCSLYSLQYIVSVTYTVKKKKIGLLLCSVSRPPISTSTYVHYCTCRAAVCRKHVCFLIVLTGTGSTSQWSHRWGKM